MPATPSAKGAAGAPAPVAQTSRRDTVVTVCAKCKTFGSFSS